MTEEKRVFYCEECGCRDVEHAMWVDLNTGVAGEPFGSWCNGDNAFCPSCDTNHIQIQEATEAEYAALLDNRDSSWGRPRAQEVPEVEAAVRLLLEKTGSSLVMKHKNGHYVLPAVTEKDRLEYQVSDGIDGQRTYSEDCDTLAEALETLEKLAET
jgi:hypothetical protein